MNPIAELPRTLADLYGTDQPGRWMLQRAGLTAAAAGAEEALAIWTQVTLTAMLRGRLMPLLTAVLQDFPDQPVVSAAIREIRARVSKRRRKRWLWFFGIGILLGGVLALLIELPRAGLIEGRVLGLPPDLGVDATVRIDGCLRPEPVSPNGAFSLACPSLDRDAPQTLVLQASDVTLTAPLPAGALDDGALRVALPPTAAKLAPPRQR